MADIVNPVTLQSSDASGDGETTLANAAAALAPQFAAGAIPLAAIAGATADDDLTALTVSFTATDMVFSGNEPGNVGVLGSVPLATLATAITPMIAAGFAAMTAAEKRAWHVATKSPDGSGWTDANGLYGEDDGLRGTAGYTDI